MAKPAEGQWTLGKICGLWAVVTLPVLALAWFAAPVLVERLNFPAALLYWWMILAGMAWQAGVSFWLLRRGEGGLAWQAARRNALLDRPCDPRTGQTRSRLFWRAVPLGIATALILLPGVILPAVLMLLRSTSSFNYYQYALLRWPGYANLYDLASPEMAGWLWLLPVALAGWALSAVVAQELFFRGVLLPRMKGAFGRWDWAANALLYALFHLFEWWMVPFRFFEGLILARAAQRHHGVWMAAAIRAVQGLAVLGIVWLGVGSRPLTTRPVPPLPAIDRRPAANPIYRNASASLGPCNLNSGAPYQVDLRGMDLSQMDLRNRAPSLRCVDFDTNTKWPPADRLPEGFDPARVLELGKDPGLGLRALHAQGITGQGVGIAVIDQELLTTHVEYADRLRLYEEIGSLFAGPAQMHGAATASLAAGKTVGAAPGADLYFISGAGTNMGSLFLHGHEYAQAIRRIIQINASLPENRKIRAISISSGWLPWLPGYEDAERAVREAEANGILVARVGQASGMPAGTSFMGLSRDMLADPNNFLTLNPGTFWAKNLYADPTYTSRLVLVPMDGRSYAGQGGDTEYAFEQIGGASWTPPWVAGAFALAAQVDPQVTPQQFWTAVLNTGQMTVTEHEGIYYPMGRVVDMAAVIEQLKK